MKPLIHLWRLAFWRWAQREIDPMHPDVGLVAVRVAELERPV